MDIASAGHLRHKHCISCWVPLIPTLRTAATAAAGMCSCWAAESSTQPEEAYLGCSLYLTSHLKQDEGEPGNCLTHRTASTDFYVQGETGGGGVIVLRTIMLARIDLY